MSAEMINRVKELLDTYRDREWRISVLRHEMENPAEVSKTEQIEAMNFAHGDGLGHTKGRVSNKTLYIALNYEEQVERMNAETTEKIAEELFELERKQNRLEVYVALLEERQADIIRMMKISKMFILSMFTLLFLERMKRWASTSTTIRSEDSTVSAASRQPIKRMCEILSVSTKTGYKIIKSGSICCLKVGRAYRIPKAHLFSYLCIGMQTASAEA